jgi:DNA-binding SARP family transcriptional activator
MEYRILGPLEALADGTLVKLGGSRPRAVLAVLLLHSGQVVSTSRLIDGRLWESPRIEACVPTGAEPTSS